MMVNRLKQRLSKKIVLRFPCRFQKGISPRCRGSNLSLIEEALASEETYLFVCHNAVMRVIDNYFNGKKSKISWTFIVKIHNLYNTENKNQVFNLLVKDLIFYGK